MANPAIKRQAQGLFDGSVAVPSTGLLAPASVRKPHGPPPPPPRRSSNPSIPAAAPATQPPPPPSASQAPAAAPPPAPTTVAPTEVITTDAVAQSFAKLLEDPKKIPAGLRVALEVLAETKLKEKVPVAVEAGLTEREKDLKVLKKDASTAEEMILNNIAIQYADYTTKASALSGEMTSGRRLLQTALDFLKTKKPEILDTLKRVDKDYGTLNGNVTKVSTKVASLRTEVASAETKLEEARKELAKLANARRMDAAANLANATTALLKEIRTGLGGLVGWLLKFAAVIAVLFVGYRYLVHRGVDPLPDIGQALSSQPKESGQTDTPPRAETPGTEVSAKPVRAEGFPSARATAPAKATSKGTSGAPGIPPEVRRLMKKEEAKPAPDPATLRKPGCVYTAPGEPVRDDRPNGYISGSKICQADLGERLVSTGDATEVRHEYCGCTDAPK